MKNKIQQLGRRVRNWATMIMTGKIDVYKKVPMGAEEPDLRDVKMVDGLIVRTFEK